jgi:hypothetical protein
MDTTLRKTLNSTCVTLRWREKNTRTKFNNESGKLSNWESLSDAFPLNKHNKIYEMSAIIPHFLEAEPPTCWSYTGEAKQEGRGLPHEVAALPTKGWRFERVCFKREHKYIHWIWDSQSRLHTVSSTFWNTTHAVWWESSDIQEEHIAVIFTAEKLLVSTSIKQADLPFNPENRGHMLLWNTFTTLHGLSQNRTKINIMDIKLRTVLSSDVTDVSSARRQTLQTEG